MSTPAQRPLRQQVESVTHVHGQHAVPQQGSQIHPNRADNNVVTPKSAGQGRALVSAVTVSLHFRTSGQGG